MPSANLDLQRLAELDEPVDQRLPLIVAAQR